MTAWTADPSANEHALTAVPAVTAMRNSIRDYDWGSTSALALLQSRTPSGGPEAELWMGTHPSAPSVLVLPDGRELPLPEAIDRFGEQVLGRDVLARFGPRLPYLFKILAIARPLSVQVHPTMQRAREKYTPGPDSTYVDPFHKPEMLYALEPIEALFGFRPPAQVAMLLSRLRAPRLERLIDVLKTPAEEANVTGATAGAEAARLHAGLELLVTWPVEDRAALVAEIAAGSSRLTAEGSPDYPEVFGWLDRLIGLHPADPMVLAPLLLDLVRMAPGQTVFVDAGVPHAYLSGLGVEIMAGSDNVLRCGLTSKEINVPELLDVIDSHPLASGDAGFAQLTDTEVAWRPPVQDFQLSRVEVASSSTLPTDGTISGPQIVLCTRGAVTVSAGGASVALESGQSAFVTATAGPITLTGDGEVFRAAPGLPR
ncbi:mannose-6-phosphate isomerase, class I [Kineosporia sp. J2-2]|uniref:mannose-6-phosphate isomerase n=1 Tax=Kineosporia corallincola TaxID=2835133 RepID=A0ABS5TA67_9ACTN|nr:mannose-6-phosphate isomerase, class I [Kineosporia corallincola]MBT0767959.1 mannose-6-phosphate isomerase, class I [Kineosporia corallincola]